MNLRNNKGVTGVDISVALIVVVLFVGLISTLVFNFSVTSQGINRKSDAINIAIQKVESLKNTAYADVVSTEPESPEYRDKDGQAANSGPYKVEVDVKRYNDPQAGFVTQEQADKLQDIIKIVKVTVSYTVQAETQKVELSTVITKGD